MTVGVVGATKTLIGALFVMVAESMAVTVMLYVAAATVEATETTPLESIVMPETEELSEVFLILQLHVEGSPVPPETLGDAVAVLPKTESDPEYESKMEGRTVRDIGLLVDCS